MLESTGIPLGKAYSEASFDKGYEEEKARVLS
jgi:hypothetical protein